jgi:hypothetical protein
MMAGAVVCDLKAAHFESLLASENWNYSIEIVSIPSLQNFINRLEDVATDCSRRGEEVKIWLARPSMLMIPWIVLLPVVLQRVLQLFSFRLYRRLSRFLAWIQWTNVVSIAKRWSLVPPLPPATLPAPTTTKLSALSGAFIFNNRISCYIRYVKHAFR